MNAQPDIIIIRGAPGSGKSQTAKSLSQFFPKGVRMEVDTIRSMVISVDWTNQEEHISMLNASAKLTIEFLQLGYSPVMVIDTFSGDKVNGFLQTLFENEDQLIIKVFALYTNDKELKRRLDERSNSEFKDFQICQKLNSDVLKWKHPKEFQLDTTKRTAKQTAVLMHQLVYEEYKES